MAALKKGRHFSFSDRLGLIGGKGDLFSGPNRVVLLSRLSEMRENGEESVLEPSGLGPIREIIRLFELMRKGGAVYIMTNKTNTTLYIGVSSNLFKRVQDHKDHL